MEFGCVIGMKCSKHLQSRGDFHADAPRFIRAAVSLPEKNPGISQRCLY